MHSGRTEIMTGTGKLDGKIAMVTGAARGMGAATARLFVQQGAKVIAADVLEREGEALAAELGPSCAFLKLDVSDEAGWNAAVKFALQRWGRIDVLVNNAGVLLFKDILETSRADFERLLSINLVGCFSGIKAVAPVMIEAGGGAIVNISSIDGMKAINGASAYVTSKWGMRGLTKAAAMDLGHRGIRVNSIHPGGIDTPMVNPTGRSRAEFDSIYVDIPMQRSGTADEVAKAALYLASDDSSYCCGTEIVVDGGAIVGRYYSGLPAAPDSLPSM